MIVKNESEVLARCLNCAAKVADELVIVDTGSDDNTREIAGQYTDEIYDFEWADNFSEARNFSFSKASGDYIMWLDADDIIGENSIDDLVNLKSELAADVIMMPYNVGFDDEGNVTFSYYRERIIKNHAGFEWREPVHEYIQTSGNIIYSDIPIIHGHREHKCSNRNLSIYRKLEESGCEFSTRALFYYARELKDHNLLCEAINKYNQFLKRFDGWIEDKIIACIGLSECYLLRNQHEDALSILYNSFIFDLPRPETCCRIASIYFSRQDYSKAIHWYEEALKAKKPTEGFINKDYFSFIPHLQLCVCYDRIGNTDKAIIYNELAGKEKPNDKAYLYNTSYFMEVKK